MSRVRNVKISKKEKGIDDAVEKEAFEDDVWGKEIEVTPKLTPTSIRLSRRTIERAKIHRSRGYQSWLKSIIEDRINTEYELYKRLRKEAI